MDSDLLFTGRASRDAPCTRKPRKPQKRSIIHRQIDFLLLILVFQCHTALSASSPTRALVESDLCVAFSSHHKLTVADHNPCNSLIAVQNLYCDAWPTPDRVVRTGPCCAAVLPPLDATMRRLGCSDSSCAHSPPESACGLPSGDCSVHTHKSLDFHERMQAEEPPALTQQELEERQGAKDTLLNVLQPALSAHQQTSRLQPPTHSYDLEALVECRVQNANLTGVTSEASFFAKTISYGSVIKLIGVTSELEPSFTMHEHVCLRRTQAYPTLQQLLKGLKHQSLLTVSRCNCLPSMNKTTPRIMNMSHIRMTSGSQSPLTPLMAHHLESLFGMGKASSQKIQQKASTGCILDEHHLQEGQTEHAGGRLNDCHFTKCDHPFWWRWFEMLHTTNQSYFSDCWSLLKNQNPVEQHADSPMHDHMFTHKHNKQLHNTCSAASTLSAGGCRPVTMTRNQFQQQIAKECSNMLGDTDFEVKTVGKDKTWKLDAANVILTDVNITIVPASRVPLFLAVYSRINGGFRGCQIISNSSPITTIRGVPAARFPIAQPDDRILLDHQVTVIPEFKVTGQSQIHQTSYQGHCPDAPLIALPKPAFVSTQHSCTLPIRGMHIIHAAIRGTFHLPIKDAKVCNTGPSAHASGIRALRFTIQILQCNQCKNSKSIPSCHAKADAWRFVWLPNNDQLLASKEQLDSHMWLSNNLPQAQSLIKVLLTMLDMSEPTAPNASSLGIGRGHCYRSILEQHQQELCYQCAFALDCRAHHACSSTLSAWEIQQLPDGICAGDRTKMILEQAAAPTVKGLRTSDKLSVLTKQFVQTHLHTARQQGHPVTDHLNCFWIRLFEFGTAHADDSGNLITLTMVSPAAALLIEEATCISFSVRGEFDVRLRVAITDQHKVFQHALVTSGLPSVYTAQSPAFYLKLISAIKNSYEQGAEESKFFFYGSNRELYEHGDLDETTILKIVFTPRGIPIATLTESDLSKRQHIGTGIRVMLMCADPHTQARLLFACASGFSMPGRAIWLATSSYGPTGASQDIMPGSKNSGYAMAVLHAVATGSAIQTRSTAQGSVELPSDSILECMANATEPAKLIQELPKAQASPSILDVMMREHKGMSLRDLLAAKRAERAAVAKENGKALASTMDAAAGDDPAAGASTTLPHDTDAGKTQPSTLTADPAPPQGAPPHGSPVPPGPLPLSPTPLADPQGRCEGETLAVLDILRQGGSPGGQPDQAHVPHLPAQNTTETQHLMQDVDMEDTDNGGERSAKVMKLSVVRTKACYLSPYEMTAACMMTLAVNKAQLACNFSDPHCIQSSSQLQDATSTTLAPEEGTAGSVTTCLGAMLAMQGCNKLAKTFDVRLSPNLPHSIPPLCMLVYKSSCLVTKNPADPAAMQSIHLVTHHAQTRGLQLPKRACSRTHDWSLHSTSEMLSEKMEPALLDTQGNVAPPDLSLSFLFIWKNLSNDPDACQCNFPQHSSSPSLHLVEAQHPCILPPLKGDAQAQNHVLTCRRPSLCTRTQQPRPECWLPPQVILHRTLGLTIVPFRQSAPTISNKYPEQIQKYRLGMPLNSLPPCSRHHAHHRIQRAYQIPKEGQHCLQQETDACPIYSLLQALSHLHIFTLFNAVQCMTAITVDLQMSATGMLKLAQSAGYTLGQSMRQHYAFQRRAAIYIQPAHHLAKAIALRKMRRTKGHKESWSMHKLKRSIKWFQKFMIPKHELACIAIIAAAIIIGIVSMAYPLTCYSTIFAGIALTWLNNSTSAQHLWLKASDFTAGRAQMIIVVVEQIIWCLALTHSVDVHHCILWMAVQLACETCNHSRMGLQADDCRTDSQMGFPDQLQISLLGGGAGNLRRPIGVDTSDVWQAASTRWLEGEDIHAALVAAQTRLLGTSTNDLDRRRFIDNRRMQTITHTALLSNLQHFDHAAFRILCADGTEHVPDASCALFAALHCGVASSLVFTDNMHWRCICLDPIRQQVLCIDPYGYGNPSVSFRRDVRGAFERVIQQSCPSWTVDETRLAMQPGSDGHSCGIWAIWINDEWMKYVQAGLPAPGFEAWLQNSLYSPPESGTMIRQDALRTHYGELVSNTTHMDPVQTRCIFRPPYFGNLFAYWLHQRNNVGGISLEALQSRMMQSRHSTMNADVIDLSHNSEADASCATHIPTAGQCQNDRKRRLEVSHAVCRDGRQGMGNTSIAPIMHGAKPRQRTSNLSCKDSKQYKQGVGTPSIAPAAKAIQKTVINATSKVPDRPAMPCIIGAAQLSKRKTQNSATHPNETAIGKEKCPTQPCRKQRRLTQCWANNAHSSPEKPLASSPAGISDDMHPDAPSFRIKVMIWNVMGLTTVREELQQLLQQEDPDILVLTETKLTDRTQRKTWLNQILKTHWLQYSSSPHSSMRQGERVGSGGVAIAVRKTLVPEGCYIRVPIQREHRSHLLQVLLQPPNSTPILLQAVYMPFDLETREGIYEAIKAACSPQLQSIVAGDMNAALYEQDRTHPTRNAADRQHEAFIAQEIVTPTDEAHRPFSHTVRSLKSSLVARRSRIDDILVTPGIKRHLTAPCTTVLEATDDSDHLPLMAAIEVGKIGVVPPLDPEGQNAPAEAPPKFVLPIKKTQLVELQACIEDAHSLEIYGLHAELKEALHSLTSVTSAWDSPTCLEEHNQMHAKRYAAAEELGLSKSKIESLQGQLQKLLDSALLLAYQNLETIKPKPDKQYLCRTEGRRLMELINKGKKARAAFEQGCMDSEQRKELHEELNQLRQERHALLKNVRLANAKAKAASFQKLVADKPKLAHKIMNGKMKDRVEATVLRQAHSGTILSKSADVHLRDTTIL